MNPEIFFDMLFSNITILEILLTIILTIIIVFIFYKINFIKKFLSFLGLITVFFIFCFSAIAIKSSFLFFGKNIDEIVVNKKINIINDQNKNNEKKDIDNTTVDNGVLVSEFPPYISNNSKLKYSDSEITSSLDKVVDDYGYESISYIKNLITKAKKFQDSKNLIYLRLEDYAFLCSMNLCNKYFYEFNDIKDKKGGFYLVLVIPNFVSVLDNYEN